MASKPTFAKSVAIVGSAGHPKSILVNGEEFPFYIAEDVSASNGGVNGLRELNVTIFVDGPISFYDKEALD